jgi:3-hydroxybutyryl-CoA dehydrogenase
MSEIQTVGIVGAGLMGTGIAEVAVIAGLDTILVKATGGSPDDARRRIEKSLGRAVERGKLGSDARDDALSRLRVTGDRDALGAADVIVESIVEDLPRKQALFADLTAIARPDAIFASNTSTLRISDMAALRPARTIGTHFFSPVPAMKLVELVHLPGTEAEVIDAATVFLVRLGKTVVPVMDSSGFVVNRLLVPYLVGAIAAYEQGLAKPDEIDTAMRLGCGHPMGPLALSDLIGLDVVYAMSKLLFAEFHDVRYSPPALLRRLVQQGQLGKKAGLGFYDYRRDPVTANEEIWNLVRAGALGELSEHAA